MKHITTILALLLLVIGGMSCNPDKSYPPYDPTMGTAGNPLSVYQARFIQDSTLAWVKCWIVGVYEADSIYPRDRYAAPFYSSTNMLVADDTTRLYRNLSMCLDVQLPSGMRAALSPKENPSVLHREVWLRGKLMPYNSMSGMKELMSYSFTPPPADPFFEEFMTTQTSFNKFYKEATVGETNWYFDNTSATTQGYGAQIRGASGVDPSVEAWLVSPAINCTGHDSAFIAFDHAINYATPANYRTVATCWISKDFSENLGTVAFATWEQLTIPNVPTSPSFTFISSGSIRVPAAYVGQPNVRVAFKYECTNNNDKATWEVKNLTVR